MPIIYCSPGTWTRISLPPRPFPFPSISFVTLRDWNPFRSVKVRRAGAPDGVLITNITVPFPYVGSATIEVWADWWPALIEYT